MDERERIYTAVDVSNLWKSCREEFGPDARVDFQVLHEMVPAMYHPALVRQRLVAYIVSSPRQGSAAQGTSDFAKALRMLGYEVRERILRYQKGLEKPTRTDWDVGITIDALDQIDNYDTFVLVSGDGDFTQLLEYLKKRGKKTIVLAFKKSTAKSLYECADELQTFKADILFTPPTRT